MVKEIIIFWNCTIKKVHVGKYIYIFCKLLKHIQKDSINRSSLYRYYYFYKIAYTTCPECDFVQFGSYMYNKIYA